MAKSNEIISQRFLFEDVDNEYESGLVVTPRSKSGISDASAKVKINFELFA